MNSIQELIKQKLIAALEAEKRHIAEKLVKEDAPVGAVRPSPMSGAKPMQSKQNNMSARIQKKQLQIQKMNGQMMAQNATVPSQNNPMAAKKKMEKMDIQRQKIGLAKSELNAIRN